MVATHVDDQTRSLPLKELNGGRIWTIRSGEELAQSKGGDYRGGWTISLYQIWRALTVMYFL